MPKTAYKLPSLSQEQSVDIEAQWEKALAYFKSRGSVIFLSDCRFWENHGFVQQSLAEVLVRHGIDVLWLDGIGWRSYHPIVRNPSPHLSVRQIFQLPLRRLPFMEKLNVKMTAGFIKKAIQRKGGNPIVWVHSGFNEKVIAQLPYVDVFSVFDDPHKHSPMGKLCEKAKFVLCQNTLSYQAMTKVLGAKAKLSFPPLELHSDIFEDGAKIQLPENFPKQTMGYIGSFFAKGFDLVLFEDFIQSYPDWGFLLMGRTDPEGMKYVEKFKRYPNFHHEPWAPREKTISAWKMLDVSLLLYRPYRPQDGAFAVKVLESVYFGVPCVGTQVPKTEDMGHFFPRSPFAEVVKKEAVNVSQMGKGKIQQAFHHFAYEMDPRLHLAKVASWLSKKV